MKICLITPNFTIAGVPLAQTRFARVLAEKGYDVDLIIGNIGEGYELPELPNVNIIILNKKKVRSMLLPIWKYFLINKIDVIFSAEDHLNDIVLTAAIFSNCKAKISCSSRVTPFDTYSNKLFSKRWFLKQVTKILMWRADALTCVSTGMIKEYEEIFGKTKHKCVFNIIGDNNSLLEMKEIVNDNWFLDKNYNTLVAAGRLAHWKGYGDLILTIYELNKTEKVRLLILGDGPLRNELQLLINKLNLEDVIKLKGYVKNPLKYFYQADIFVHASHVESLGNVLVEAMMCGCTVVSTDCPTGPKEVLQNGKYGYLVPMHDPVAMAIGIKNALESPIDKELLKEAIQPFTEDKVIKKHFEILEIIDKK